MSQKFLVMIQLQYAQKKNSLTLNKSAYTEMYILDLSKVLMYQFHYNYIKNKYGNNSRLLFTDTDSLMYEIKTEYFYEDFSKDRRMPKYYGNSKKLVVGKMKDEIGRAAIKKLVGLKSKMYSFLADDNSGRQKAKGVNKSVVEKITHHEYKDVLFKAK